MKKTLLLFIVCCIALVGNAQPRSIGSRLGTSLEVDYQHTITPKTFVEIGLGLNYIGGLGPKIEGSYNFMLITQKVGEDSNGEGQLSIYAGPGFSTGLNFIYDNNAHYRLSAMAQIGAEYLFSSIPLIVSIDIRPTFGFYVIGSKFTYDYIGLFNMIPTIGLRYAF